MECWYMQNDVMDEKFVISGVPIKGLQDCGGIAQPNEKVIQTNYSVF